MVFNPTSYKVICFDWDDVLGVLREKDQEAPYFKKLEKESDLSDCARRILTSDNNMKSYYHFATQKNTDFYIQAFARLEFKKIFNRIYEVNNQYTSPPLVVKIITTGSYKEIKIKEAMNQFYTDGETWFNDSRFPIEYFNRNYWTNGDPYDPEIHDLDKGQVIEDNFPFWQKEMPKLKKTDIYFYDNNIFNVHDVKLHGFPNAMIFPTTTLPKDTSIPRNVVKEQKKLTYAKDGPAIFEQLHQIIDEYDVNKMLHQLPLDDVEAQSLNNADTEVPPHQIALQIQDDKPNLELMSVRKKPNNDFCCCQLL